MRAADDCKKALRSLFDEYFSNSRRQEVLFTLLKYSIDSEIEECAKYRNIPVLVDQHDVPIIHVMREANALLERNLKCIKVLVEHAVEFLQFERAEHSDFILTQNIFACDRSEARLP